MSLFHDSLVSDLAIVCMDDAALDMTISERRAYGESLDPALLKTIPGRHPTWFVLRALSHLDLASVESQSGASKLLMCFIFGVKEIRFDGSKSVRPGLRSPSADDANRCIWSTDEMTELTHRFGGRRLFDVGNAVHQRALEGNAGGGSIFFEPLQSSLDALRATESRRVARLKASADATKSTDEPPVSPSP